MMKRAEFIKLYSDLVAEGRRKNHPDIRPSEAAVSRMSDDKTAGKLWAKHRRTFATFTVEQARTLLLGE
jgi:hypothetical protein